MTRTAALMLAAAIAAAGCTTMPLKKGPHARLIPGCKAPRDRADVDITVELVSLPVAMAKSVAMGCAPSAIGCAFVQRWAAKGKRPWCRVVAPIGFPSVLEHELRHCECWDHPHHNGDHYHDHG